MRQLTLLFAFTLLYSCNGDISSENESEDVREDAQEELTEFEELLQDNFDKAELPYESKVNFDNYEVDEYMTVEEFDLLELFFVFPEGFLEDRYCARDRIKLESGVTMLIVTFEDNEHELSTYLVTYNKDDWYTDNVRICYDEIAEGFLRIESEIEGNTITRTTTITLDEPIIETEKYFIEDDGKIVWEEDL